MKKTTKLCLEDLEDRMVPSAASIFGPTDPNMVYGGGPVLTHPQVTNIYCAGAVNMDAFTNVLVGPYGNALASAYGVGSGTLVNSIGTTASIASNGSGIVSMLKNDFHTGVLPPPVAGSSLYTIWITSGNVGGRDNFTYNGQQVDYTYVGSTNGNVQALARFGSLEYVNAVTDPGLGYGGWRDRSGGQYVGDTPNTPPYALFDGYYMRQFLVPSGFYPPPPPSPPTPPPAPQPASPFAGLANFYEAIIQDFETMISNLLRTVETDLAHLRI